MDSQTLIFFSASGARLPFHVITYLQVLVEVVGVPVLHIEPRHRFHAHEIKEELRRTSSSFIPLPSCRRTIQMNFRSQNFNAFSIFRESSTWRKVPPEQRWSVVSAFTMESHSLHACVCKIEPVREVVGIEN